MAYEETATTTTPPPAQQGAADKTMQRDAVQLDPAEAALITQWAETVKADKAHWEKKFKTMRWGQKFVRGRQWQNQADNDERYVANLALRHIRQRTAAVYAKNPKAAATRRPRMDFQLWDGNPESLQAAVTAIAAAQQTNMEPPPDAVALIEDVNQGKQQREMLDRVGRTLEIVFNYSMEEQKPRFKTQAKQLVVRTKTCGVGYVKLAYQRLMGRLPTTTAKIDDASRAIAALEARAKDLADQELHECEAKVAELKAMMDKLQSEPEVVLREGLIFDFPPSTSIIPDSACTTQIKGFIGSHHITQEYTSFTTDDIKEIYGVDVGTAYTGYTKEGAKGDKRRKDQRYCCVWEIYDLDTQLCMTICDGYQGWLKAPGAPDVWLEQFHPFYALTFNDIEDEEDPFPPSDPELLVSMCVEYNRSREGLREHRIANRPGLMGPKGLLSEDDKKKLGNHDVMEYVELDKIGPNNDIKVGDKIVPIPKQSIDPAVYETDHLFVDLQRIMGDQEANFGGVSEATATEVNVAQDTRLSSLQSDIDELDEFFTEIARGGGQILLTEMSKPTVLNIAGDGAVWPELSRKEIATEVLLSVKAGSSGRPNQAADLAKLERGMPFLLQLDGIAAKPIARRYADLLDIEMEELYIEGLPSITARNGLMKPNVGDPAKSPSAQGEAGKDNQPAGPGTPGGSKAAFPAAGG